VPRYQLINEDGDDLGRFQGVTRAWSPGDVLQRGPGKTWRVVSVTEGLEGDDVEGYLVVKPSV